MKKWFLFLALVAIGFACSSVDKAIDSIKEDIKDDIKDDIEDKVEDELDDAEEDLVGGVPDLNGRFLGTANTAEKSFDVDVLFDDEQLSIQLKNGADTFTATGTILVAVSSSGKKNSSASSATLTWDIQTSNYPKFINSEAYSGIVKLEGNQLSLEFNFTPGSSPSGFGQGDWQCSAQKE